MGVFPKARNYQKAYLTISLRALPCRPSAPSHPSGHPSTLCTRTPRPRVSSAEGYFSVFALSTSYGYLPFKGFGLPPWIIVCHQGEKWHSKSCSWLRRTCGIMAWRVVYKCQRWLFPRTCDKGKEGASIFSSYTEGFIVLSPHYCKSNFPGILLGLWLTLISELANYQGIRSLYCFWTQMQI